jgi:hypothetical protein
MTDVNRLNAYVKQNVFYFKSTSFYSLTYI